MAKFTLTFIEAEGDDTHYEIVDTIARQHKLDVNQVQAFVERFVDGDTVTLQFDTATNKCFVLYADKEGVNDIKDERNVVAKTDYWEKYTTGRAKHCENLQAQIDEALEVYKAEEDKKSAAAKNLLRFIEDVRQELKGFKGANWNKDGGESDTPFIA